MRYENKQGTNFPYLYGFHYYRYLIVIDFSSTVVVMFKNVLFIFSKDSLTYFPGYTLIHQWRNNKFIFIIH